MCNVYVLSYMVYNAQSTLQTSRLARIILQGQFVTISTWHSFNSLNPQHRKLTEYHARSNCEVQNCGLPITRISFCTGCENVGICEIKRTVGPSLIWMGNLLGCRSKWKVLKSEMGSIEYLSKAPLCSAVAILIIKTRRFRKAIEERNGAQYGRAGCIKYNCNGCVSLQFVYIQRPMKSLLPIKLYYYLRCHLSNATHSFSLSIVIIRTEYRRRHDPHNFIRTCRMSQLHRPPAMHWDRAAHNRKAKMVAIGLKMSVCGRAASYRWNLLLSLLCIPNVCVRVCQGRTCLSLFPDDLDPKIIRANTHSLASSDIVQRAIYIKFTMRTRKVLCTMRGAFRFTLRWAFLQFHNLQPADVSTNYIISFAAAREHAPTVRRSASSRRKHSFSMRIARLSYPSRFGHIWFAEIQFSRSAHEHSFFRRLKFNYWLHLDAFGGR